MQINTDECFLEQEKSREKFTEELWNDKTTFLHMINMNCWEK